MQNVSQAWINNQLQTLTSEAFLRLVYRAINADVQNGCTVTTTNKPYYSYAAYITDGLVKEPMKYATLEGLWKGDGSCAILPATINESAYKEKIGFASSAVSKPDGTFETNPIITMQWDSVQLDELFGLTINWAQAFGEYATSFLVSIYNGSSLIDNFAVTDNSKVSTVINHTLTNFTKIVLEIRGWSKGGHRARVDEILLGYIVTFDKNEITAFEFTSETDPISTALPTRKITFSLDNTDGKYNPDNPQSIGKYLDVQQLIQASYGYKIGGNIEWIKCGDFWLSDWNVPTNGITASFTAGGLLDFMQAKYIGTLNDTLYNIAVAAITQAELPLTIDGNIRWTLDDCLKDISVNITDDYDYTIAETLQMISNAACCVLYADRSGILHIEPYKSVLNSSYLINRDNSYQFGEYSLLQPLLYVDVNDGMYITANQGTGNIQNIDNPFIQTPEVAEAVGEWVADLLNKRKSISGEYRADPRLDTLDGIICMNKYGNSPLMITSLKYSFTGSFKGSYIGRVYTDILAPNSRQLNTFEAGDGNE